MHTSTFDTVIFDIDGTLADCEHRRHFVAGKKKDFDAFYAAMDKDPVVPAIRCLCNQHFMCGWQVVLCTGRPEQYREVTEQWLKDHGIYYHRLLMRSDELRYTPDFEVKQQMLDELRLSHNIMMAVDDRNQVVDMWRRNGITCLQVAEGDF